MTHQSSHEHFLATVCLLQLVQLLWEDARVVAQLTIELTPVDYGAQFEICRAQIPRNSKLSRLAYHHVPHIQGALIPAELGCFVRTSRCLLACILILMSVIVFLTVGGSC